MAKVLKVGSLTAAQGEKAQGMVTVPGTDVKVPVTLVNGVRDGVTVSITAGVHGGEYPGIECGIRLGDQLTPEGLSGAVIIVHPINVPCFFARYQYVVPQDGKNLNRVFPGTATGTVADQMAYFVTQEVIRQGDFYVDMHGGDMHEWLSDYIGFPTAGPEDVLKKSKEAAEYFGVARIVGMGAGGYSIPAAVNNGIPALLIEIGSRGLWDEEEVAHYVRGMKNLLKFLKVLPGEAEKAKNTYFVDRTTPLKAEQTGCWYPCVKPDDKIKKGQKLGEIRDFFRNVLGEYFSPIDGEVSYIISSLAVEKGDPLGGLAERK